MPLSAFSIGMITAEVISSGAAPGSRSDTLTVAGSALRKQVDAEIAEREDAEHDERHHEHRGEDGPADAEFRQHRLTPPPAASTRLTFMPSARLSTSVSATDSPSFDAVENLHAIADPVAGLQLVRRQRDRRSTMNTR